VRRADDPLLSIGYRYEATSRAVRQAISAVSRT